MAQGRAGGSRKKKRRRSPKPASAAEAAPKAPVEEVPACASSSAIQPWVREVREIMDGCSATQKSQYFLGAMAVLALTGRLDVVEIFCMVPGHTKFDSDIICQKIAAKYNASDTYNHGMLNGIVKLYATAHAYDGDSLMTFKRATPGIFSPVDGITNYRSFLIVGDDGRMDDDLPGVALPDEDAVGADAAAPPAPPAYPDRLFKRHT